MATDMLEEIDLYQFMFLAGAGLLVLVQTVRGWRAGVARQLVNLGALLFAYGMAALSGRLASPIFQWLGYPFLLLSVLLGSVTGALVYYGLAHLGGMIFRKTGEQRLGMMRLGYGAGGSAIGFVGGVMTVWLTVLCIRFVGTVAQAEVNLATPLTHGRAAGPEPSLMAMELAHLKRSLDAGPTGAVMNSMDPIPQRAYSILEKIAKVTSDTNSMNRFVSFPGTKALTEHPKIVALRSDPEIVRKVQGHDFVSLLANQNIVAAVNDPQVGALVRRFELEKALDYALDSTQKNVPAAGQ